MKADIYGTSWCGFCKHAIALCEQKSIEVNYVDVDDTANMKKLEERIGNKVRSVPQIFLNDIYVPGGFNGLKNELKE